jgi:hypothetical protein
MPTVMENRGMQTPGVYDAIELNKIRMADMRFVNFQQAHAEQVSSPKF